jgi:hypothetical protein
MSAETVVAFGVTEDRDLLGQYFALRRRQYHRHFPTLPEWFGKEEEADRVADIVVATMEERVVGGARISYAGPGMSPRLPLESDLFELPRLFPEWRLGEQLICEFCRHAVEPEFGALVSRGLAAAMAKTAARREIALAFTVCPRGQTVLNRRHCRDLGLQFEVFPALLPPNPFNLEMALCLYRGFASLQEP